MDKPSYYSIITADVRYDPRLKRFADCKVLYSEITALSNQKGYCHATNSYFADIYDVDKTTISRWIKKLKECGYLKIFQVYKPGTKQIIERRIFPVSTPVGAEDNTPIGTDANTPIASEPRGYTHGNQYPIGTGAKDNITSINTTSMNNTSNNITTTTTNLIKSKLTANGIQPTESVVTMVESFLQTMSLKAILYTIQKAGMKQKPSGVLLEKILKDNQKHQLLTLEQVKADDDRHQRQHEPPQPSGQSIPIFKLGGVANG